VIRYEWDLQAKGGVGWQTVECGSLLPLFVSQPAGE
jgi:hypothetical protein